MFHRTCLAVAAVLTLLSGAALAQNGCVVPGDANRMATQLMALTNDLRAQNGRGQLGFDIRLSRAAQALACDIQRTGRYSHRASDGTNSQLRVRRAGYADCLVAENLAWGYPQPGQILHGWMTSTGHQRNMLHPRVRDAGIGIAQGLQGPIWVMVYADEC